MMRLRSIAFTALAVTILSAPVLRAQSAELAKQTQNPVGDLVSIPLQFNFFTGADLEDHTVYNLNVQPVIPIRITRHRSLIVRPIIPYFDIPVLPPAPEQRFTGLGDIQLELFVAPSSGSFVWGVGPVLSFPTATNDLIRTGNWGAGPAVVIVKTTGHWVVGSLASQIWGFAGHDDDRDLNNLTLQPFANYNFGSGWAITFAPLITADWDNANDEWTVPLGAGISKVTAFGQRPVNLSIQYYFNVDRPQGFGNSQIRFVAALLFPSDAQHPAAN